MPSVMVERLRGVWMGVSSLARTREFYEQLGARFEQEGDERIVPATLGGARLVFEESSDGSTDAGVALLFDIHDADAFYSELGATWPQHRGASEG